MPVVVVPGSALVVPPRGAIELVLGLFTDGNAPNGLLGDCIAICGERAIVLAAGLAVALSRIRHRSAVRFKDLSLTLIEVTCAG